MSNIPERIANIEKLIDGERNPIKKQHYRNVLNQLQTKLELLNGG